MMRPWPSPPPPLRPSPPPPERPPKTLPPCKNYRPSGYWAIQRLYSGRNLNRCRKRETRNQKTYLPRKVYPAIRLSEYNPSLRLCDFVSRYTNAGRIVAKIFFRWCLMYFLVVRDIPMGPRAHYAAAGAHSALGIIVVVVALATMRRC